MRIDPTSPLGSPANLSHAARVTVAEDRKIAPVGKTDSVRISDEARALAEAFTPVNTDPNAELTPEQIAEIRRRIAAGIYDSLEVIDAVARRILDSGDLEGTQADPDDA